MLKINIFWVILLRPFYFTTYVVPFFDGQLLKCDILPVQMTWCYQHNLLGNRSLRWEEARESERRV